MKGIILKIRNLLLLSIFLIGCSSVKPVIVAEHSNINHVKPSDSKSILKGEVYDYIIWYNNQKWILLDQQSEIFKEMKKQIGSGGSSLNFLLMDEYKEAFVAVINESRFSTSYDEILKNAGKYLFSSNANLEQCEFRKVNGKEVLYITFTVKDKSNEMKASSYVLSSESGMVQIIGISFINSFRLYENNINEFLNGLDFIGNENNGPVIEILN